MSGSNDDTPLDVTPVLRSLDFRWNWFGLQLEDAPFALIPMLVAFGGSAVFDYSPFWSFLVAVAFGAAVVVLKWGKPEGFLQTQLILAFGKRRLSHKERDPELDPFPLDRNLEPRT